LIHRHEDIAMAKQASAKKTERPDTLGALRASGYRSLSVREELRENLTRKLEANEPMFEGILGYDQTVIPQLENAILAGHDVIMLGERGQAKTRIARSMIDLLDEEIPIVEGSEINDDPFSPVSAFARQRVTELGDDTPIAWVGRDRRFAEKLATPDTTIADLIGEVDPIKVAEGRYLSDELVLSFGLIPRTNRGVFNLNELPDLAERIQVGLLNILEERDVQIRGFQVRLPLDLMVIASANPEDYTNRGRIITPLKDRFGAQIRTHYPSSVDLELQVVDQEQSEVSVPKIEVRTPTYMRAIIGELTHAARRSADVSQRSGVSVRMSIANMETLHANALRRAIRTKESLAVPRISDLTALQPSSVGKLEFETFGEVKEDKLFGRLITEAVRTVFAQSIDLDDLDLLLLAFDNGLTVQTSAMAPSLSYVHQISNIEGVRDVLTKLGIGPQPAELASGVEFLLEGLHVNRKLSRNALSGSVTYRR
jgi:magnesium chelatase subunit I